MATTNNLYECLLMLDSNKYNADPHAVIEQIHHSFQKHHCDIQSSRPWDERKLAYPVKKHKKATFFLIFLRAVGSALKPVKADFAINESILRYVFIKHHPKMEETLLALGRDEHALAIQAPGLAEDIPEAVMGGGRRED
jgi:small subunit ribosomal protein S6